MELAFAGLHQLCAPRRIRIPVRPDRAQGNGEHPRRISPPRHEAGFTDSVCRIVKTKPETTYDNFAGDFGERFVPGYERPSTVDFLMDAPFEE
jgi:hypothetical protein